MALGVADPRRKRVRDELVVERDQHVGRRSLGAVAGGEHDRRSDQGAGAAEPARGSGEADDADIRMDGVGILACTGDRLAGTVVSPGASATVSNARNKDFRITGGLLPRVRARHHSGSASSRTPLPTALHG